MPSAHNDVKNVREIDFGDTERGEYEPTMREVPSWALAAKGGKYVWMPWADDEYKWSQGNFVGFREAREYLKDGVTDNLTFVLQSPDGNYTDHGDRLILADFDDVRDPDTGEVIPEVRYMIEALGLTFIEASKSGGGLHGVYAGVLPEGFETGVQIPLRDDPVFGHEEAPKLELFDRKRNKVTTGKHVEGTPAEARDVNEGVLLALCRHHGDKRQKQKRQKDDSDDDGGDDVRNWEPELDKEEIMAVDTTTDMEEIFDAIAHVTPRDISLRSEKTEDEGGRMSFDPSWEESASGTRLGWDGGWIYRAGNVGIDALSVVSLEEGLISSPYDYPSGENFWEAIEELRRRGAHIPEYASPGDEETDYEPLTILDIKRLSSLTPEKRREYARRNGLDWPTTGEARERLRDKILESIEDEQEVVIDAPTALGKTYTVATEDWLSHGDDMTGNQPVVHFSGTKEAREQAAEASAEADVDHFQLKGREDLCPMAMGNHDADGLSETMTMNGVPVSEWFKEMCDRRGIPFSVAHTYVEEHNDQGVDPDCTEDDNRCPAITQWDNVPRDDGGDPAADIIHATHQFAHVPGLVFNTNVIFDERPDFGADFDTSDVRRMVTAFLKEIDATTTTWEGFITLARFNDYTTGSDAAAEKNALGDDIESEPDREWYFEDPNAHTAAPAITRAIYWALQSEPDINGRHASTVSHAPPRLDKNAHNGGGWNRQWVSVVIDDENEIRTVRMSPDLSLARSVIGLDAHPHETVWKRNTSPDIGYTELLDRRERRLWRRFERGLTVVQVGDATRPLSTGEYFDERGTEAFFERLHDEYGDDFSTAITASSVEHRTKDMLEDLGVGDADTMHFGEEKSRNDFADEDVGAVNGSIDPGDDYVIDLIAEADLDATPEIDEEGNRAHGRGFVGPDADRAEEILASVRENHVAQAAGRYARNAEDSEDTAIVFVRTDAIPDGFADLRVPGVTWTATGLQRDIIRALQEHGKATAAQLSTVVDASKRHIAKTLKRLAGEGMVDAREGEGAFGATVFVEDGSLGTGVVDVEDVDITNGDVWDSYTWSFAIHPPEFPERADYTATSSMETESSVESAGDSPQPVNQQATLSAPPDD